LKHEDGSSREPNEFGVGVFVRPITGVHISSDRGDRRNLAKRADDFGMPNISAVNDLIDAGQTALGLGPQQPVRVRNDPDSERHRSGPHSPEDLLLENAADFRQAEAKVEMLQSNPASQ
jgi:hypothetical protein